MPELGPVTLHTLLAAGLLLIASALSILGSLLDRAGPIRLHHFAEEAGGGLRRLFDERPRFDAFRLWLNVLAGLATPAFCLALLLVLAERRLPAATAVTVALLAGFAVLVVTELISRGIVNRDPESALRRLTGLYRTLSFLLAPIVALTAPLLATPEPVAGEQQDEDEASEDEIDAFIAVGTQEGILEPGEGEMVRGIVDLGDTLVRSVMTPRIDMDCAPVDSSLEELASFFRSSRHSRLPLYRESVDQIAGILHVQDLLAAVSGEGSEASPASLVKRAFFVPGTKAVDELLREFQARKQQMAIVVDEYGGTMGLVTAEDLVEEIVGEILDEHEEIEPGIQPLGDGRWRLEGRTQVEELGALMGLELDHSKYETVGGLVMSALGDVPSFGEVVQVDGLRFTVEEVHERRVDTLLVERASDEAEPRAVNDG